MVIDEKNFAPAEDKQIRLRQNPQTRYGAVVANRMKNRKIPTGSSERLAHKRFHSQVEAWHESPKKETPAQRFILHQLDWISEMSTQGLSVKNKILVALQDDPSNMLQTIADKKSCVVATWKRFTKLKTSEDHSQRRIENTSWRLWFKQRIEYEKKKELERLEKEMDLQEFETGTELMQSALLNFFSGISRENSLVVNDSDPLRRVHSTGSLMKKQN